MGKGITIQGYFTEHAGDFPPSLVKRTAHQLLRHGIETMDALCEISAEQIENVRNIGGKSLEIVLSMRDKYAPNRR